MANLSRKFTTGKMNKELDERLVPDGQYIDATNIRVNSSEGSNGGVVENSKGNELLFAPEFDSSLGLVLTDVKCIGSFEDGARDTIYWFVTSACALIPTTVKRVDFIISYNTKTNIVVYHAISTSDSTDNTRTTLNFQPKSLMTGINLVDDLLFFTDGYNEPRKININRTYARPTLSGAYIDNVSKEEFMVLKKFPSSAPGVVGEISLKGDDFLEDKFISFAYRYKYSDGEYSATSQFSAPVFFPKTFKLSHQTNLNEGANNLYNAAKVSYDSGSSDVIGIDILFKEMANNNIRVVEKIDKEARGLEDSTSYSITFDGNKVYTYLPESEILRLYDNVPRTAQAQTVMSNRLFYGNYLEGYDMIDSDGKPVRVEFDSYLTKSDFGFSDITALVSSSTYTISGTSEVISDSKLDVDLTGSDLNEGDVLSVSITLDANDTEGGISDTALTGLNVNWSYQLRDSFDTVHDLATSEDFINKIGTFANIKPVYHATADTSCSGGSFTDIINCASPTLNGTYIKYASGINTTNQGIVITSSAASSIISLQIPAIKYVDNVVTPTDEGYLFFDISSRDVQLIKGSGGKSLHSSRGYEVGMIYMDEFGRASNTLVSSDGGSRTDAADSVTQNTLSVSIPTTQKAPSWATSYKLVLKQDKGDYETIYSSMYVRDFSTPYTYFLLEGENAAKVEAGDILVVKRDATGYKNKTIKVTVLDKTVEEAGFVTSTDANGNEFDAPVGVYAKINALGFSTIHDSDSVISIEAMDGLSNGWSGFEDNAQNANNYPKAEFGPFGTTSGNIFTPYPIEAGASIALAFNFKRKGTGDGNKNCERRTYELEKEITASRDYDNFWEWWDGDNVANILNSGIAFVGGTDNPDIENEYATPGVILDSSLSTPVSESTNFFQFVYKGFNTDGNIRLNVTGARACGWTDGKQSEVTGSISINKLNSEIVFETEPVTNNDEIWYENEESFDIVNGLHKGNVQTQTSSQPAIVDTSFFNSFTFGNGVESYRVKDSIIGNKLTLGNRVHSTQAKDFKAAARFADLTYSGVYNDESNINRLNEFNGGLLNFKPLEDSFGEIGIIDARKTDILVIQEDKISVVLAGKNLLSMTDSVQGGALLSVPEVLGAQIAREEEYGISHNPESYASFGNLQYFTDVKRGAILQLNGDALSVISDAGMSSYFRDSFDSDSNTFKHGGFDPYTKEYVLSNSSETIEDESINVLCGAELSISLEAGEIVQINVEHEANVGNFDTVIQTLDAGSSFNFSVSHDGTNSATTTATGAITKTISMTKSSTTVNSSIITLSSTNASIFNIKAKCVVKTPLTVVSIVLNDRGSKDLTTHVSYRSTLGSVTTPQITEAVTFQGGSENLIVSSWESKSGYEGLNSTPSEGETLYMTLNSTNDDTFTYVDDTHDMHILRTDTLYTETEASMTSLISASTLLTDAAITPKPNGSLVWEGSSIVPSTGEYLYLVYDLRTSLGVQIAFGANASDACCNTVCDTGYVGSFNIGNRGLVNTIITYTDFTGSVQNVVYSPGQSGTVLAIGIPTSSVDSSDINITLTACILI